MTAAWVLLGLFVAAALLWTGYAAGRRSMLLPPPAKECERGPTEARGRYQ